MSDASATLVPPPPFKDRRGWLIAFGIVEILIGCFFLLMIALALFALSHNPPPANGPVSPRATMAAVVVMYGTGALVFVVIGIGSVQARRWGRIASLVVSWCWLALGILTTAMMAVVLPVIMKTTAAGTAKPIPASTQSAILIGMLTFFAVCFVVLPLVFVLFYSNKNVKATCENISGLPPSAMRKPIAVIVASAWYGFSALSCLGVLFLPWGYPLFGFVLKGWVGRIAVLLIGCLCAWIAWNLYQQRMVAWRVAVGWLVVGWASMLLTQTRLGVLEMYRQMGYSEADVSRILPFVGYGLYAGMVVGVALLVFLLGIRKHFTGSESIALQS